MQYSAVRCIPIQPTLGLQETFAALTLTPPVLSYSVLSYPVLSCPSLYPLAPSHSPYDPHGGVFDGPSVTDNGFWDTFRTGAQCRT